MGNEAAGKLKMEHTCNIILFKYIPQQGNEIPLYFIYSIKKIAYDVIEVNDFHQKLTRFHYNERIRTDSS